MCVLTFLEQQGISCELFRPMCCMFMRCKCKRASPSPTLQLVPDWQSSAGFKLPELRSKAVWLHAAGAQGDAAKIGSPQYSLLCCQKGDPVQTIPKLVKDTKAALLVTDFASLRDGRKWRDDVSFLLQLH